MNKDKKTDIGFLIFPGFPMACLTSMIEPFRAANEISGRNEFGWSLISETGETVMSSAEVAFEVAHPMSGALHVDMLFLLSSPTARFDNESAGNAALRKLERHGTVVGAISGGVFPLARSGLMGGHPCSVHWVYDAVFREEFPEIRVSDEVILIEPRRQTASGAAAAFDLALHHIAQKLGDDIATEVACWFQHPLVRGEGVRQRIPTHRRSSVEDMLPNNVKQAIAIFASNIEMTITVAEVAKTVGVTTRHLERLFKRSTGKGPQHYYRSMRMNAARQLVQYSNNTMQEIAVSVGYASPTPLLQNYAREFGVLPQEDRVKINMFRVRQNRVVPSV